MVGGKWGSGASEWTGKCVWVGGEVIEVKRKARVPSGSEVGKLSKLTTTKKGQIIVSPPTAMFKGGRMYITKNSNYYQMVNNGFRAIFPARDEI